MALLTRAVKKKNWVQEKNKLLRFIAKADFESCSKKVIGFLRGKAPVKLKYEVAEAFAKKHSGKALGVFHQKALLEFGFDYSDISGMDKKKPHKLSYMQALSHGFAYFGYTGFRAAVRLSASQTIPPYLFTQKSIPLSTTISLMVCHSLMKRGKLDKRKAADHIQGYLERGKLSPVAQLALLHMMKTVNPGRLRKLVSNPKIDSKLRRIIHERFVTKPIKQKM